jgi:hypothetical protein
MNVRMTVPWRFPLRHVLRRDHKPASRTGKAHWFLWDPTTSSRHCCQSAMVLASTAIAYPHLWHPGRSTLGPVRPAGWRAPKLTGAFPADVGPAQPGERVCAGHRPAIQQPPGHQNTVVFDTPTGYKEEGLRPRFRRSEALSCTRWQVKDSNLRSFRDGFTVHSHWPLGQPA